MIGNALYGLVVASACLLGSGLAEAAVVEATRVMRSGEIIYDGDVIMSYKEARRGEAGALEDVIGMEVRASLRPGRAVRLSDLRQPILVRRNELVEIIFKRGSLIIRGEGRALRDGGRGERVRVMNLDSRMIVTGRVTEIGRVEMSR